MSHYMDNFSFKHQISINDKLKLIQSYLKNRKQRTKINSAHRSEEEMLFGVPQGSILETFLFNIFLCDLFLSMNEMDYGSYADDNTPCYR